ncbi:MAG: 6-carboxytetrahydropterin synthase [bacterium]
MPVHLTKRTRFCAAHRLFNPDFSDEKNWEVFGPCNNPNGHGHDYVLEVALQGEPDPETGMIINLRDVSTLLAKAVIDDLDHKNLNLDVPWLKEVIPTIENLVVKIWERLEKVLPEGALYSVRLCESDNNSVVYYGKRVSRTGRSDS